MAQEELEPASDQGNLLNLEMVGKDAAMADEVLGLVGTSQFFSEFSREDILLLAGYMDVYRAQPGDIIIREGDIGDFMLLVIEGEVDILKKGFRGEQRHMTSVGPGLTLGEMSMIDGEPRFATCLATRPTVFEIDGYDEQSRTGWSVCVHGPGREITDVEDPLARRSARTDES